MEALRDLWAFIWAGYNLPFTLALVVCLFLSAIQFLGLSGDGDADLDTDADIDVDTDVDVDTDADSDFTDGHLDSNPFTALLDFMGVGRVPLTIFLLVFTLTFGLSGWLAARLFIGANPAPPLLLVFALWSGVFILSSLVTGRLSRLIARLIPSMTTSATAREQLIGRVARVASPQVDTRYGQVKVRDDGGTLLTLFAITPADEQPIARDSEVILVEFDPQRRLYTVVPLAKPLLEE